MTLLTKESSQIRFSPQAIEAFRRMAQRTAKHEIEVQSLTPPCPDGSGEIGRYDQEASKYFGVVIYSTPSKKYFRWNDLDKRGTVIPPEYVPERLR